MARAAHGEPPIWHVALLVVAALVGCSEDSRLATHPVEGSVIVNGVPAAGCVVTFVPLDAHLEGVVLPAGTADEAGVFRLTTYETDDGAPAGRYGVTLLWEANEWPGMNAAAQVDPVITVRPDRLLGRFQSPEKSGIEVVVAEGENTLEPFRLDDVALLKGSK